MSQEYYAAEKLLQQLPSLSDDELKWDYLNYLKWTETIALVLGMVEDRDQAVRVVKLALEVDWQLGARLAGEVSSQWQQQTVDLVSSLGLPQLLKIHLLGLTKSDIAIPNLSKFVSDEDYAVSRTAAEALGKIGSEATIPGLIHALSDKYSTVREPAAEALGEIGSEAAISGLLNALSHEDYAIFKTAAEALGEIGSEAAIPGLLNALSHAGYGVSWKVVEVLGKIGSKAAIPGLLNALFHGDSEVSRRAAEALGEIGSEAAIPGLLNALSHENFAVRRTAVQDLGKIGAEAAIPGLIHALSHENFAVRQIAADALGKIGSEAASEAAISELIDALLSHENFDYAVPWEVVKVLGEIGSETAIPGLLNALSHQDSDVRMRAAKALGEIGSEAAIPGLLNALSDEYSFVRSSEVVALGKIGSEAAISGLLNALSDEDRYVREDVAEALGKIGSEAAIPGLIHALSDKYYTVRKSAADALGEIGSEAAIPELIHAFSDPSPEVCESAADALGKIRSETAIPGLIHVLFDADFYTQCIEFIEFIRRSAADALGKIGTEATIPGLLNALSHQDSDVRMRAAKALGKIGTEAAIPGLLNALSDKLVRGHAADALGKIGTEAAIPGLLNALSDKDFFNRMRAAKALGKIGSEAAIPGLLNALSDGDFVTAHKGYTFHYAIQGLEGVQKSCQYYNIKRAKPQISIPPAQPTSNSLMYILHLSDLHFGTLDQANLWSGQLADDLRQELDINQLNCLILSGDIANYSTPEEYQAAKQLLDEFRQDFTLEPEQIIIVPGNHDLNWQISEEQGYIPKLRKQYQGSIDENSIIDDGGRYIAVLDPEQYPRRFEHFSGFYHAIKNQEYPLEYEQQYSLTQIQDLLILGLNSAWQLDHHYKDRASINNNALTNALREISRNEIYRNCPLKMAVWHHPLHSPYQDRIKDESFLGRLAVNGFHFFLHGHVHQAQTDFYRYDTAEDGRKSTAFVLELSAHPPGS